MDVRYTNNEAYFDLIEEIDAIIDRNGVTVMCEIQGYVSEYHHGCCAMKRKYFFSSFNNIFKKNPKKFEL
jgi:hypothetical protein